MIEDRSVVAIIPARKGSIGVVGKNYKEIDGKPLIEWSLLAALQSGHIDEILVTTNCLICEHIAMEMGSSKIKVIRRPDSISTATAKTEEAMKHALESTNRQYDLVCLLQPTSPARKLGLIDRCLQQMLTQKADSAIAVSKHTPFFWKDGKQLFTERPMRQSLAWRDFYFHDSGNFYAVEKEMFDIHGRIGVKPALCEISEFEAMQIDTVDDFRAMEALASVYGGFL